MSQSKGMIGGLFSKAVNNNNYLVTSIWESEILHTKYIEHKVPVLREKSNVSSDLIEMTGRFIKLQRLDCSC